MTEQTIRRRLDAWVDQYDHEHRPGASVARAALRQTLALGRARPSGLDLAEVQHELRRTVEILQAFGGYLVSVDLEEKRQIDADIEAIRREQEVE